MESKKYIKISDDELKIDPHYNTNGGLCEYKIKCWKCKKWNYYLLDMGVEKIYTCFKCKEEYAFKKRIEKLKSQGLYKPLTKEEIEERDRDQFEW